MNFKKYAISIFIFLFLINLSFSQNKYEKFINSFSTGNKSSTLFSIKSSTNLVWYDNKWLPTSKTLNTYDTEGNIIECINQKYINETWINFTRVLTNINKTNSNQTGISQKSTEIINQEFNGESWNNVSRELSIETGTAKEITNQIWRSGHWENIKNYISYYNPDSKQTEVYGKVWKNGQWENQYKIKTSPSSNYFEIKDTVYSWINSKWSDSASSHYVFDSLHRNVTDNHCIYSQEKWLNSKRTEYTYKSSSDIIINYEWDGFAWVNIERSTTQKNPPEFLKENWENNKWVGKFRSRTNFDSIMKKQIEEILIWENDKWQLNSRMWFTFDEYSNPQEMVIQLLINDEWVNSQKTVYNYESTTAIDRKNTKSIKGFELSQNYPNPFNPSTKIEYSIPENTMVNLTVYNYLGQQVETLVNKIQSAGNFSYEWKPENIPSGIYYYRIHAGKYNTIKKMMFLK
jgi:hypothetical protein